MHPLLAQITPATLDAGRRVGDSSAQQLMGLALIVFGGVIALLFWENTKLHRARHDDALKYADKLDKVHEDRIEEVQGIVRALDTAAKLMEREAVREQNRPAKRSS